MTVRLFVRRSTRFATVALLASALSACATGLGTRMPVAGEQDADKYLFDAGSEGLKRRRWLQAREYFRRLVDTYPTSQYRQDAKLGIGDSFLGEGRVETYILAASEFREFLRFFPLAPRADYAQYRLALSQVRQVLRPERDQTATYEAIKELELFIKQYPDSQYLPDVLKLEREMRDRLAEHEFLVGRHYFRTRWYPGAVSRLERLMKDDPKFTRRDEVYYYLGESLYRLNRKTDALPWYQKLVEEFAVSEYLEEAKERITEMAADEGQPEASTTSATR
jgi:outer membrane protein assembly factor BamD